MSSEVLVRKRGRPKKVVEPEAIVILAPAVTDIVEPSTIKKPRTTRTASKLKTAKDDLTLKRKVSRAPKVMVEEADDEMQKTRTRRSAKVLSKEPERDVGVRGPSSPATNIINPESIRKLADTIPDPVVQETASLDTVVEGKKSEPRTKSVVLDTNQSSSGHISQQTTPSLTTKSVSTIQPPARIEIPVPSLSSQLKTSASDSEQILVSSTTSTPKTDSISSSKAIESLESALLESAKTMSMMQSTFQQMMREQVIQKKVMSFHKQINSLQNDISISANMIKDMSLRRAALQFAEIAASHQEAKMQVPAVEATLTQDDATKVDVNPSSNPLLPSLQAQSQSSLVQPQSQQVANFTTTTTAAAASPLESQSPSNKAVPSEASPQSSSTPKPQPNKADSKPSAPPPPPPSKSSPPPLPPSRPPPRSPLPKSTPPSSSLIPPSLKTVRPTTIPPPPPPPKRPTELPLSELKKDPNFRRLSYSWTGLIVGIPVMVATSWWLWNGHQKRQMERKLGLDREPSASGTGTGRGMGYDAKTSKAVVNGGV